MTDHLCDDTNDNFHAFTTVNGVIFNELNTKKFTQKWNEYTEKKITVHIVENVL